MQIHCSGDTLLGNFMMHLQGLDMAFDAVV